LQLKIKSQKKPQHLPNFSHKKAGINRLIYFRLSGVQALIFLRVLSAKNPKPLPNSQTAPGIGTGAPTLPGLTAHAYNG